MADFSSMSQILYVYAFGRTTHPLPESIDAIDGSERLDVVRGNDLVAFFTLVDDVDFSQNVIDARAKDVEWLGAIGYRHQNVMSALMHGGTIELIRRLLEKQALRRMDAGTLSDEEIERVGAALMKLEEKMAEMKQIFGLADDDLNLRLGPIKSLD